MSKKSSKKKKGLTRLIVFAVILLVVIFIVNPKIMFFLPEGAKNALGAFVDKYLKAFQPLQNSEGGFDFLRIISLLIMAAGCVAVNAIIQWVLANIKFKKRRSATIKSLVSSVVKYVILIYGLIYGLSILGFNVGAVIASLGVLGLIVGFGAQSLIEDIITGFFIVIEGTFQVGDIIAIDEWRGEVKKIGIRTTTLLDTGGNAKVINNSDIRNLVNLSDVTSVAVCIAPIAYETDLVKAEKVVKKVCEELPKMYPDIFPTPGRYLGVDCLNDHSVDLKFVTDVQEVNIFGAKRLMNREIFLAFNEAGIEIPFMQQVVHMAKD